MKFHRSTFAGQFLALVAGTILIAQLMVIAIFFIIADNRSDEYEENAIIRNISTVYLNINGKSLEDQTEVLNLLDSSEVFYYLSTTQEATTLLEDGRKADWFGNQLGATDVYFSDVKESLSNLWVYWFDEDWESCFMLANSVDSSKSCPHQVYSMQLSNGHWLNSKTDIEPGELATLIPVLISVAISLGAVFIATTIAVKSVTRPLKNLASTAEKFGRGEDVTFSETDAPQELALLNFTLSTMQSRLTRFVEDRTKMLAAISHDLRTPITSLRLRAEFIDDKALQEKMISTLEDMESMVESTLEFAKQDFAGGKVEIIDVQKLLCELAEESDKISFFSELDSFNYPCRRISLKRAIRNILDNAIRYGDIAKIQFGAHETGISISVTDNGPGIPEDKLDDIFKPFYRLDMARNTESGNVGLGLAIARTIIHKHGGSISAANTDNGLKVAVELPL